MKTTITIPDDLADQLRARAARENLSIDDLILKLLDKYERRLQERDSKKSDDRKTTENAE